MKKASVHGNENNTRHTEEVLVLRRTKDEHAVEQ